MDLVVLVPHQNTLYPFYIWDALEVIHPSSFYGTRRSQRSHYSHVWTCIERSWFWCIRLYRLGVLRGANEDLRVAILGHKLGGHWKRFKQYKQCNGTEGGNVIRKNFVVTSVMERPAYLNRTESFSQMLINSFCFSLYGTIKKTQP